MKTTEESKRLYEIRLRNSGLKRKAYKSTDRKPVIQGSINEPKKYDSLKEWLQAFAYVAILLSIVLIQMY